MKTEKLPDNDTIIYKNINYSDLKTLFEKYNEIRFIITLNDANSFFWDSSKFIHDDISKQLGLTGLDMSYGIIEKIEEDKICFINFTNRDITRKNKGFTRIIEGSKGFSIRD